ncbi:GGDEF domain-containing protein [Mycobacterium adipatum]|uniref:GGDEF domain-containing protein n=1 Tax=Mycobacterium adipatum TaxID=1682113 RepID=UPI003982DF7A
MSVEDPSRAAPSTADWSADDDHAGSMGHLLQAVQELSLARGLPEIQRIVRAAARALTGCDGATFVLRDNDMCWYADEDAIAPLWKGRRFPIETCISGWTMLNRRAVVIRNIYDDDRIPHEAYRPTFVQSLVMVPIRTLDPVGAIGNYWADEHMPTEREVSLLQALADATSVAMENVQIYAELEQRVLARTADLERVNNEMLQLSVTDDLTGVTNRRGFYLLAESVLAAARRDGLGCLFGFIDVDGLKKVNDRQGHVVGDALIVDVAHVLRATLRTSDLLARIGGDEFCVLAVGADSEPAALKARITAAMQHFNDTAARSYEVSTSIGLMAVPAEDTSTVEELLARADELMYEAKNARPA